MDNLKVILETMQVIRILVVHIVEAKRKILQELPLHLRNPTANNQFDKSL